MKKIIIASISLALALSVSAFAAEANETQKPDINSKTCEAILKGAVIEDGKFIVENKKFEKPYDIRTKIDGVLVPGTTTVNFGIISGLCSKLPHLETAFEIELAARGLNINSFDPGFGILGSKLETFGSSQSWRVLLDLIYKKPELLGAFIDKVKEKRFGRNTLGIPEAKDILVDGTYKKELTEDEEKVVDEYLKRYLEALGDTPAAV